jgi:uncharacterized protein YigE (DUF2233 family)
VDPQRERIAMYWQNADGKALVACALLADIDRDGRADGDERRIYAKAYAPLGLYMGVQEVRLTALPAAATFIRPGGCFICRAEGGDRQHR